MPNMRFNGNWVWNPCWTYLLLKNPEDAEALEKNFPAFIEKNYPPFMKAQISHYLQPILDIHLKSNLDYEIEPNAREMDIYIFMVIGLFILLIAAINFMNLATARSASRAREVGMRKVLGASRGQLILQFLGESVLLSFLSVLLALVVLEMTLPFFSSLAGKNLHLSIFPWWQITAGLVALGLILGLVSGIYPAFYLSNFQPVEVFKNGSRSGKGEFVFLEGAWWCCSFPFQWD